MKPVKGAASPPPPWLPPLGRLKSIIVFRSTLVKLHGFIKRGGFIRAELRHSGTMSIKCGSIKYKFLEITVHSCLPTASHPTETLSFCLNGFDFKLNPVCSLLLSICHFLHNSCMYSPWPLKWVRQASTYTHTHTGKLDMLCIKRCYSAEHDHNCCLFVLP